MNFKGQGALEYLLMIGAGIAIAAIVLYFVLSAGQSAKCESYKSQVAGLCAAKPTETECTALGDIDATIPGLECIWTTVGGVDKCTIAAGINWNLNTEFCG